MNNLQQRNVIPKRRGQRMEAQRTPKDTSLGLERQTIITKFTSMQYNQNKSEVDGIKKWKLLFKHKNKPP